MLGVAVDFGRMEHHSVAQMDWEHTAVLELGVGVELVAYTRAAAAVEQNRSAEIAGAELAETC